MKKITFLLLFFIGVFLAVKVSPVIAQDSKSITIVNPIRGSDFWNQPFSPLDTSKQEYQIISQNHLRATWLLRYDAMENPQIIQFLKGLDNNQEIGLFMEITPSLTQAAGVTYHKGSNWHSPYSLFLSGYSQTERRKLIDADFDKYRALFGSYPQSVGAWWIDAYSLDYMKQKYGIDANLDVSDQYSTDQYQVWGQYFSLPFYPSRLNALLPASSPDQKIGVVTIQWATRDPYNSYGNGAYDSTFSVQPNDYLIHKLNTSYLQKMVSIYPQITLGLENDYNFSRYGKEYSNQIKLVSSLVNSGQAQDLTMSGYALKYSSQFPDISPNQLIQAKDPLGGTGQVVWYQTPKYRIGIFFTPNYVAIRDLREYFDSIKEPCYNQGCKNLDLAKTFVNAIDEVTYGNRLPIDQGFASDVKVINNGNQVQITYTNQALVQREIKLLPNDIEINGRIRTLATTIAAASISDSSASKVANPVKNYQFDWASLPAIFGGFLKFLLLSLFFFYLPGYILTRQKPTAIAAGWCLFTLVGWVFGLIGIEWGVWLIPVVSLLLMWRLKLKPWAKSKNFSVDFWALGLIILGSLSWIMTVFRSGLKFNYGLGFWGPNGHDAIWHLSLISQLQRGIPPQNPIYAGTQLHNYHYFFDLLVAISGNLLALDNADLLLRFFPLFISVSAGILMYLMVLKITQRQSAANLSLFFLYFGGGFGFIVSLLRDHTLGGESIFWSQQAASALLNPPFAVSLVILMAGLLIFAEEKFDRWKIASLVLLFGTVIEFKVYAGLLILGALVVLTLYMALWCRRYKKKAMFTPAISVTVLSILMSLAVFLPNNSNSASLLVVSPLWLVNSMIDFPDRLGWQRLSLARQAYTATGNWFKLIASEAIGLVLFFAGNLGTRIFFVMGGIGGIRNIARNRVLFLLLIIALEGSIVPLVFVQKGNDWNIIQFFYYSLLAFGVFAAIFISDFLKSHKRMGLVLLGIIIIFTVPTTISVDMQYIPIRPPAQLPNDELNALNFLKTQSRGTVLSAPFDPGAKIGLSEPIPLYAYTSTAYISAYSNHPSFLEDTINLDILGINYAGRLNDVNDFLKIPDRAKIILKNNHIKYVYLLKSSQFQPDEGKMGIQKIYENNSVEIFKVL